MSLLTLQMWVSITKPVHTRILTKPTDPHWLPRRPQDLPRPILKHPHAPPTHLLPQPLPDSRTRSTHRKTHSSWLRQLLRDARSESHRLRNEYTRQSTQSQRTYTSPEKIYNWKWNSTVRRQRLRNDRCTFGAICAIEVGGAGGRRDSSSKNDGEYR